MPDWVLKRINRAHIKISPQAKDVLQSLAFIRPDVARVVLKTINAKHWDKLGIERLKAPKEILDPFLAPTLRNIQSYIFDCLSDGTNLSLEPLIKLAPKPKNIKAEMPFAFSVGEKPASLSETEFSNLKLIRLLRKTHLRLLSLSDLRVPTRNSGNIEELKKIEYEIDGLLTPLVLARGEIKEQEEGYRAVVLKRINDVFLPLHNRKTSAANALIISAYDLLCAETDKLEASRLKKGRSPRAKTKTVQTPLGKEVTSLTLSGYGIKISPDGSWSIPLAAYKVTGTEHYRDKVKQKVPEDKVVRQNRHKIDSCSGELSNNIHNIKLLQSAKKIIKDAVQEGRPLTEGEAASVRSILYSVANKYERAFVREKEEVNDRLVEGIFQINRGLPKLCLAMIARSIEKLNERNEELGSMVENLTAKGALELSEIQFVLRRDDEIRKVVNLLLSAISSPKNLSSPQLVTGIAERINIFLEQYLSKVPRREYGIKRAMWRLHGTTELLRRTAGKIEDAEGLKKARNALINEPAIRAEIENLEPKRAELEQKMRRIFLNVRDVDSFMESKPIDPAEIQWATEQKRTLLEVTRGMSLGWFDQQILAKAALQKELDRISAPLEELEAQLKLAEDHKNDNVDAEQLSSALKIYTARIIGDLISASDALYTVYLDVELKHTDKVNEGEIDQRVLKENKTVRDKISSFKQKEQA